MCQHNTREVYSNDSKAYNNNYLHICSIIELALLQCKKWAKPSLTLILNGQYSADGGPT